MYWWFIFKGPTDLAVRHLTVRTEEVGYDIDLLQYHMTLECNFGGVAFLVIEAQPAMTMKSAPFSVADLGWFPGFHGTPLS